MAITALVAYASKHGATAEIADKMGQVLRQQDLQADVLPVNRAGNLTQYQAVIVGSAVYVGKWQKEAVKFLRNNEELLAERFVWLFSSGALGEGDPVELMGGWSFPPEGLRPTIDRIQPRDIAIFHGVLDMKKLNFLEKFAVRMAKSPVGDFRDWDAITSWTTAIADELKKQSG